MRKVITAAAAAMMVQPAKGELCAGFALVLLGVRRRLFSLGMGGVLGGWEAGGKSGAIFGIFVFRHRRP